MVLGSSFGSGTAGWCCIGDTTRFFLHVFYFLFTCQKKPIRILNDATQESLFFT